MRTESLDLRKMPVSARDLQGIPARIGRRASIAALLAADADN